VCCANESITVGRSDKDTFYLDLGEEPSLQSIELVKVNSDKSADIRFGERVTGHVRLDGKIMSIAAARDTAFAKKDEKGVYRVRIGQKDKADVVIGHVSFYFDWVHNWEVLPKGSNKSERRRWWLLPLLLVPISIGLLIHFVPQPEPEKPPERVVTLLPRQMNAKAAMGQKMTEDGGAQKGESGKVDSKPVEKLSAAAQLRRANLGSLVDGLTSVGSNTPTAVVRTKSVADLAQPGTGGLSTKGLGTAAGGKTVGIGRTVGQGQGGFEGTGRLGLSGDSAVEGGTGYGRPDSVVKGGLSPDVIESIIRRRQHRIRLCYERQLNFNPKLAGKIALHFVIGKTGGVAKTDVTEDTMKNETVKGCVLSEVKTWIFPAPEGGTLVDVDYPFVFESSARANK
jgi:hypothetical protein